MDSRQDLIIKMNADMLATIPLFKDIPRDQAAQLLPKFKSDIFYKEDLIFAEHSTDRRVFFIRTGRVKLTKTARDGRIELINIYGRGQMVGEISVLDPEGGPRSASAIAMVDETRTASLSREDLLNWLKEHPKISLDLLETLANRMRKSNERLADLVFTDVSGRLAKTLLDLAVRFGSLDSRGLIVPHELTQEELAQLVGSSRETVNKALADFVNRGWIQRKGHTIIIFQPGKLIHRAQ